jgi:hypothetical protein
MFPVSFGLALGSAATACQNVAIGLRPDKSAASLHDNNRRKMTAMINKSSSHGSANLWLWIGLVAVISVALSLRLQCALPFAALAALAVLNLRRSEGLALVGLAWAINQGLGFTVLGYPHEAQSYAWGAAIGLAAVGGLFAGEAVRDVLRGQSFAVTAVAVLAAAYTVYEVVLYVATAWLPSSDLAVSWGIIAQIGVVNAVAFAVLMAVHQGVVALGLIDGRRSA